MGRKGCYSPQSRGARLAHARGIHGPACPFASHRRRRQLLREISPDHIRLAPPLFFRQQLEVKGRQLPAGQGGEQATHCRLQYGHAIAEVGGLSDRFIDDGIERADTPDQLPPNRTRFRLLRSGQQERAGKPSGDFSGNRSELGDQPTPGVPEIGAGEHDTRADDADADLAGAGDGEHESLAVRAPRRAEFVARDDRRSIAGKRRRVGREVAQVRGEEPADRAPQSQTQQKSGAVLRKAGGQDDDCHGADHRADQSERGLAQGGAETGLTDDRGGRCRPVRVVELQPERNVECQADRGP